MANTPKRALVAGASRGLGLGLVEEFLRRGWAVTATARGPSPGLDALGAEHHGPERLRVERGVDIDDDGAVARLREALGEEMFDVVFVVAGVATEAGTPVPFQDRRTVAQVFQTNAVSPIRFAEAFHAHVAPGGVIALMTSRLGSVSLNDGGGWESYRASKAALNTLARSFQGRHARAPWSVVLLHPGWVRTDMGGRGADLDVATSARGMVRVLEGRLGTQGCVFLDYKGDTVPW